MAVWSEVKTSEINEVNRLDAEFWHPTYVANEINLRKYPNEKLGNLVSDFRKGIFYILASEYTESGVTFYRSSNVGTIFPDDKNLVYISERKNLAEIKTSLSFGDIMLSKTGKNAASIVMKDVCNVSQDVIAVKIKKDKINPFFLVAYLNTTAGENELKRRFQGQVQMHLSLPETRKAIIPIVDDRIQKQIEKILRNSYDQFQLSQSLYTQAQQLLERELGLDKLVFDKPLSYEARLSEVVGNNRADAEFYHAKFKPLIDIILNYKNSYAPLYKLSSEITPNVDLRKETGEYDYIEIGDISISDGSYSQTRLSISELPANAKIKLSGGELLISQVRPTRGAISIISDELPYRTISSGAFYTCTINDLTYREIIWLYIRSIKSIFEKFCGGTSYPTIDSHYIRKLPVPLFEKDLASKVRQLVLDSKKSKIESQQLLEQAKRRVEELIEQAVQK